MNLRWMFVGEEIKTDERRNRYAPHSSSEVLSFSHATVCASGRPFMLIVANGLCYEVIWRSSWLENDEVVSLSPQMTTSVAAIYSTGGAVAWPLTPGSTCYTEFLCGGYVGTGMGSEYLATSSCACFCFCVRFSPRFGSKRSTLAGTKRRESCGRTTSRRWTAWCSS